MVYLLLRFFFWSWGWFVVLCGAPALLVLVFLPILITCVTLACGGVLFPHSSAARVSGWGTLAYYSHWTFSTAGGGRG